MTATRFLRQVSRPLELGEAELKTIAEGLARTAHWWPDPDQPARRSRDLMVVSEDFEAWVVAWPPGATGELHDHGDAIGVVVVARGELIETSVRDQRCPTVTSETTVLRAGASTSFDGARVHDFTNMGEGPALSVHVYAPRLRLKTFYAIVDGRLEARQTIHYRLGEVVSSGTPDARASAPGR